MDKKIRKLLEKYNIEIPSLELNEELYSWLQAAKEELSAEFVSDLPMQQKDIERLKFQLGMVHPELDFYYARSTPWRYGIEDYFEAIDLIQAECILIFKRNGSSEKNAKLRISEGSPLWPVHIRIKGPTAVAFSDAIGRLCLVEASRHGGLGFGRPISIGLRNFLVLRVIAQLFWFESDGEVPYTEGARSPKILSIGEWPIQNPPNHYLIDCFNLINQGQPELV